MFNNVLLINPPLSEDSTTDFFVMPPGILSVAAYLRENGETPSILDLNVIKNRYNIMDEFKNTLLTLSPKLLGVSIMVAGQLELSMTLIRRAKSLLPDLVIIVGGAHVSQFYKEILENYTEINFIVIGEGEIQSLWCSKFAENNLLENVPDGIAYRDNNYIRYLPKKTYIKDFNSLSIPAYDLINVEDYRHDITTWHNPYKVELGVRVPIITSRGCPNICSFCSVAGTMGRNYRTLTPTKVVDMIQFLNEKYNIRYFAIFDANFAQNVERVIEICNEIKKRNLKIYLDLPGGLFINKTGKKMFEALVEVGLIRISMSVESGDPIIRNKIMKKNVKEDDIFYALEIIRKYPQVLVSADVILGVPEETKESLELSYNIMSDIDVDDIVPSIATPYPGTVLYEQCVRDNLFLSDIDYKNIWNSDWYNHSKLDKFIIKPYNVDIETLKEYKDKMLILKKLKINNYKKRMKLLYDIESNYKANNKD